MFTMCGLNTDNNLAGYIFDLDGTLYDFRGKSFSESPLGQSVKQRYYELITQYQLGDPVDFYRCMVSKEQDTGIGISLQVAHIVGKKREEILRNVWGKLDPSEIISDFLLSQKVLTSLSKQGKSLFLVTAAPLIWADKACKYMQIQTLFKIILTLEDFGPSKKKLLQKYPFPQGFHFLNSCL